MCVEQYRDIDYDSLSNTSGDDNKYETSKKYSQSTLRRMNEK